MMHLLFEFVFISPADILGWLSVVLLGAVIAIPYLKNRARARVPESNGAAPRPYLNALWPHYWFAPAVAVGSFVHAWIPMASGHMPHTSMRGLWLATYALGLVFLQILLGLVLRFAGPATAAFLRRVHFVCMVGIVALLLAHLLLNGPLALTS